MFSTNNTYGNPNVDIGWYESNGCRIEAEVARGCKIVMEMLNEIIDKSI